MFRLFQAKHPSPEITRKSFNQMKSNEQLHDNHEISRRVDWKPPRGQNAFKNIFLKDCSKLGSEQPGVHHHCEQSPPVQAPPPTRGAMGPQAPGGGHGLHIGAPGPPPFMSRSGVLRFSFLPLDTQVKDPKAVKEKYGGDRQSKFR